MINAVLGLGGIAGPGCGRDTIRVTARGRVPPLLARSM
jgi:hypothetical protein